MQVGEVRNHVRIAPGQCDGEFRDSAAALGCIAGAGVVDEDLPHNDRRHSHEMAAAAVGLLLFQKARIPGSDLERDIIMTGMRYDFLIDTYETERIKVISAWSMFRDDDLGVRPNAADTRGRSFLEHMVHQCVSEDIWFRTMLAIDVGAPPLPKEEVRLEFMRRYEEDSGKRLVALRKKDEAWWEGEAVFFDVRRTRAWVMTRRMTHTAHHRGQQLALLRMLGREEYSNYGPTADTGGLMQNHAPTIYPYPDLQALLEGEAAGGRKGKLPGTGGRPVTERPDERR